MRLFAMMALVLVACLETETETREEECPICEVCSEPEVPETFLVTVENVPNAAPDGTAWDYCGMEDSYPDLYLVIDGWQTYTVEDALTATWEVPTLGHWELWDSDDGEDQLIAVEGDPVVVFRVE